MEHEHFMREAIQLSQEGMDSGSGGPFGAVIVKDDHIISRGQNRVTSSNDPTAHAEVVAIREACKALDTFSLEGCVLYTSCEPCPMCLAAAYWARVDAIYFGNTRTDAAHIGFDDAFIYKELTLPIEKRTLGMHILMHDEAQKPFENWQKKIDKIPY